ncbi:APC family permease [Microbacterium ulmi]|uniref:APC family permease n=1 Tax=Microbacterium ulmi TaxID=179095 RepID=A0A7Y2Q2B1_9MICO|nr:APC family permease [Microbacterium ulmi]NII70053.1 amino acid transporter [Microbacterium ulmi]NNH04855.1 APC family permease [Microbacterium ulmi]
MSQTQAAPREEAPARGLTGSLGATAIVFMVVAAASPLTVVGGATPLGILIGNGVGFPSLYAVAAVVLLLFAVGLATMARHVPRPGAFFTYVGYGFGRGAGLAAAWIAMLTYTVVQLAVYGYLGYILSVTVAGVGGPSLAWWLYALAVVAIVGILGYRHIDLSSKVLGVLLVAEVAIVLVLVAAVTFSGGAEGLSAAPFLPENIVSGSPGVGLTFAIAAFIGFEATAIFRDEARDPDRTIPRATYTAVVGIGVFYTLASWAMVMAWGPNGVMDAASQDPGTLLLRTVARYLGTVGEVTINVLLITSLFACVLSFHNVITRYQHSMANAGVLPARLATVHAAHRSPHAASIVQTVTAAVLLAAFALLQLDPVLQVFTWFSGVATLSVVLLMAVASGAVIAYFLRTRKDRRLWHTLVAPALGLLGLVGIGILIVAYYPMLVGDVDAEGNPVFGTVSWILIALIVAFPVGGAVQAAWIRARRPAAYAKLTDAIAS